MVTKKAYKIPKKFFTLKNDGKKLGLTIIHSNKKMDFYVPSIIFSDNDNYYIKKGKILLSDSIMDLSSNETIFFKNSVCKLDGVYCINKGYASFRPVSILERNQSYIIVEKLDSFSIDLYDRIALDGRKIKENQLTI